MSLDILDILFKLDYFVCLLIGFPLNIILIILIIFKTPKEMKTHSRILIQNCVLDILMLINQMLVQPVKSVTFSKTVPNIEDSPSRFRLQGDPKSLRQN